MPVPVPAPAPPPPPLAHRLLIGKRLPTLPAAAPKINITARPPAMPARPAINLMIPVRGNPSITPGQALALAGAAGSDAGAQQYVLDTIGSARAGNPEALGNANLMSLATKLQIQAKYVNQWVGPAAAARVLSGIYYAVPAA